MKLMYRIAVSVYDDMSKRMRFDHYADKEELRYLRVNEKGIVEKLMSPEMAARSLTDQKAVQADEAMHVIRYGGEGSPARFHYVWWEDVSDTHIVEYGQSCGGNVLFESMDGFVANVVWGAR